MVSLTGGISGFLVNALSSFLFWVILVFVIVVAVFGTLVIRKKKKLQYEVLEITNLGNDKVGIKKTKAGWFKTQTLLFGLWDYAGEEILKVKDGREIQKGSSEDFNEIFGKRGLIVARKPDDPKILLPVSRMRLTSKSNDMLMAIAPGNYRDASTRIIDRAVTENKGKLERFLPAIIFGTMAIIFLVAIILITQMVKSGQTEASNLIIQAGQIVSQASNNVLASTVAP